MTTQIYGDFVLASRVRIDLPRMQFLGGPWTHLATVTRSLSEYVALLHGPTQKIYLEEISATGKFHAITEDELWVDLLNFLVAEGVLGFNKDKEVIQGLGFGK
jgi:hypothetical protein